MKSYVLLLFILLGVSCQKPSPLEQLLSCESSEKIIFNKTSTDFNKNFSIKTSTHWKTNLYYDDFQSSIMTADTTKALNETFIFEAAIYNGALEFTAEFNANLQATIAQNNQSLLQEDFFDWQGYPAYFNLVKGMKNERPFQELSIYINHSPTTYLRVQTQVYGTKNVRDRLCYSLQVFNGLKIK
ncbi:MAG: hypothetical protein COB60_11245 [Flavobacteriaceae bacterium]|nr:MAG: hypothetical protein COB60_11245 [Flavobacteriaceae bacterium]